MSALLTRILGPHWRTTLTGYATAITGLLTILAAAPYELGDLASIIPPEYKARLFAVGAVATFLLRIIRGHVTSDAIATKRSAPDATTPTPSVPPAPPAQSAPPAEQSETGTITIPFLMVILLTHIALFALILAVLRAHLP